MIIKKIIIENFRSIKRVVIDCENINVFSGLNDTGKSNILKALNLYFNDQTDFLCPLKFNSDYSKVALASAQRAGKRRQQIKIKVHFVVPDSFSSLKNEKDVFLERVFYREGNVDSVYSSDEKKSQITRLYHKIKYFYIPALKGPNVLQYLLGRIGEHQLISPEGISKLNEDLNAKIGSLGEILTNSNIDTKTSMGFPVFLRDFWEKLIVNTEYDSFDALQKGIKATKKGKSDPLKKEFYQIPLDLRGEGVKSKYIPPLLKWMQSRAPGDIYVWGVDEPENSLEFRKAEEVADLYYSKYCLETQMFLTTHSLAFIFPKQTAIQQPIVFRCFKETLGQTQTEKLETLFLREEKIKVCEEIGALEVQKEMYVSWREKDETIREQRVVIEKFKDDRRPILYVEGMFDKQILEKAWQKTFSEAIPLIVQDAGGARYLANFLRNPGLLVHKRTMIGLWDCDSEGYAQLKGFFNEKKFKKVSDIEVQYDGQKIFGIVLPTPVGREIYTDVKSSEPQLQFLSIEHYFTDDVLKAARLVKSEVGGKMFLNDGAKKNFAENVLSGLDTKAFKNFDILFTQIKRLIA